MNVEHVTERPTQTEPAKPLAPRTVITARIRAAHMPQVTKKLATRLLERNLLLGDTFHLTFGLLRQMCHGATNMDVAKHLRRMRKAELIEYEINHQSGQVTLRFVV